MAKMPPGYIPWNKGRTGQGINRTGDPSPMKGLPSPLKGKPGKPCPWKGKPSGRREDNDMTERKCLIGEWENSQYQKYAWNFFSRNLWKVAYLKGDLNDLMQEAAIEFILMKRDYGDKINSPQHFMSLYKLCLHSHLTNMSIKDSRNRATLKKVKDTYTPQDQRDTLEERENYYDRSTLQSVVQGPIVRPDAEINVLLNESSPELKEVLKIFFNAPTEIMETLRKDCSSLSPRQFWNRVLRHVGFPQEKSVKLMKELEDRLS